MFLNNYKIRKKKNTKVVESEFSVCPLCVSHSSCNVYIYLCVCVYLRAREIMWPSLKRVCVGLKNKIKIPSISLSLSATMDQMNLSLSFSLSLKHHHPHLLHLLLLLFLLLLCIVHWNAWPQNIPLVMPFAFSSASATHTHIHKHTPSLLHHLKSDKLLFYSYFFNPFSSSKTTFLFIYFFIFYFKYKSFTL